MTDKEIKKLLGRCDVYRGVNEIKIALYGGGWTYDDLNALALAFGTREIYIDYEREHVGHSDETPGDTSSACGITIKNPSEVSPVEHIREASYRMRQLLTMYSLVDQLQRVMGPQNYTRALEYLDRIDANTHELGAG